MNPTSRTEAPAPSYSHNDPAMLDQASRRGQAEKIVALLDHFIAGHGAPGAPAGPFRCLDVGCSTGVITAALASRFGPAVGIDVDVDAVRHAQARAAWRSEGVCARPAIASGLALPFPNEAFAIAVCNQVYQYVANPPALLDEIRRVLVAGGVCFFSARNLVGVLSRRNWRPLLDRLSPARRRPQGRAGWRATAGTLHPYWVVRGWAAQRFEVFDYTRLALTDPALARYFAPHGAPAVARAGLAWAAQPVMPTHLWVLRKPGAVEASEDTEG